MTFIHIPENWRLPESAATPESHYLHRREFLSQMGMGLGALGLLGLPGCSPEPTQADLYPQLPIPPGGKAEFAPGARLGAMTNPRYRKAGRRLSPEELVLRFNNFYEFSLDKAEVWKLVDRFETQPWTIEISGLVDEPRTWSLEELEALVPAEERRYRFRCVEAWAMTVPWIGLPLGQLIQKLGVQDKARYVRFKTFLKPEQAPNQNPESNYAWPYYEALTIEEARNELTMLATGLYGRRLAKQNGAPIRLVAPWKYGLKNIKSIVSIEFVENRPPTFWNAIAPDEYSWHSNVDPEIPHVRWSQASEKLLGSGIRVPTKPYNGYGDQVAGLYRT
jgi:methionine sulfoxide reductase catalytic subunit